MVEFVIKDELSSLIDSVKNKGRVAIIASTINLVRRHIIPWSFNEVYPPSNLSSADEATIPTSYYDRYGLSKGKTSRFYRHRLDLAENICVLVQPRGGEILYNIDPLERSLINNK